MDDDFEKGKEYHEKKDYKNAIQCFNSCIERDYNVEECVDMIVKCYFEQKDYKGVIPLLKKQLEASPDNPNYLFYFAFAMKSERNFREALKAFRGLKNISDSSIHWKQYASFLYENRRYVEAKNAINEAIRLQDNDGDYFSYQLFILINLELKEYHDIINEIDNLDLIGKFSNNNQNEQFIQAKGLALYKTDREKFEEFINEYKESPVRHYLFAQIFYEGGKFEEASKHIRSIIEINIDSGKNGSNGKNYLLQGKIYKGLKKILKAVQVFKKCINTDRTYIPAYIEIAKIYLSKEFKESDYENEPNIGKEDYKTVYKKRYYKSMDILNEAEKYIEPCNHDKCDDLCQNSSEILFLLYKIEAKCQNKERADARKMLDKVRDLLLDEEIRKIYSPSQLNEILCKYFEIHHLCRFYKDDSLTFRKEDFLEKGGFGEVYKGKLGSDSVAVKKFIFKREEIEREEKKKDKLLQIFQEISTMEICSKNFKYVLDVKTVYLRGEGDNLEILLVTPYMRGRSCKEIRKAKKSDINIFGRIDVLKQVANVIKHLQSFDPPYIHNDIKPGNILLEAKFNKKLNFIKLCDFGACCINFQEVNCFTPEYVAPELLNGATPDKQTDIYSFGILCWEFFALKKPFEGKDREEIKDLVKEGTIPDQALLQEDTPNELKNLILRCLKINPEDRPSIKEICQELKVLTNRYDPSNS